MRIMPACADDALGVSEWVAPEANWGEAPDMTYSLQLLGCPRLQAGCERTAQTFVLLEIIAVVVPRASQLATEVHLNVWHSSADRSALSLMRNDPL